MSPRSGGQRPPENLLRRRVTPNRRGAARNPERMLAVILDLLHRHDASIVPGRRQQPMTIIRTDRRLRQVYGTTEADVGPLPSRGSPPRRALGPGGSPAVPELLGELVHLAETRRTERLTLDNKPPEALTGAGRQGRCRPLAQQGGLIPRLAEPRDPGTQAARTPLFGVLALDEVDVGRVRLPPPRRRARRRRAVRLERVRRKATAGTNQVVGGPSETSETARRPTGAGIPTSLRLLVAHEHCGCRAPSFGRAQHEQRERRAHQCAMSRPLHE